MTTSVCKC